jgi:hypothetical protein
MTVTKDWNPKQKELNMLLSKENSFKEGISLCLTMHNELHDLKKTHKQTIYQSLIENLLQETAVWRPENKFSSIAWNLYHITRIEDAVTTLLIEGGKQTYTKTWQKKLGISFTDTGNAWTEEELVLFNKDINLKALLEYRKDTGSRTQKILQSLDPSSIKRKPDTLQVKKILSEGVVTEHEDSIWLMDFWGNKTITGLLTMPVTRHQIVHINDSFTLREKWKKRKV